MKITKSKLKQMIKEELSHLVERAFYGEKDRWSFSWAPTEKTWELSADGNVVATGTVTPKEEFVGQKGTNLISAVDDYKNSQKKFWKYEMHPKSVELPENEKEGWKIIFSELEEDDAFNLYLAVDDAKENMLSQWG